MVFKDIVKNEQAFKKIDEFFKENGIKEVSDRNSLRKNKKTFMVENKEIVFSDTETLFLFHDFVKDNKLKSNIDIHYLTLIDFKS